MNRGLETVGGEILVVSQFTLYGNCRKGRRPDFLAAARPEAAIPLYEKFVALCRERASTPRPANSAPICWSTPSTTAL